MILEIWFHYARYFTYFTTIFGFVSDISIHISQNISAKRGRPTETNWIRFANGARRRDLSPSSHTKIFVSQIEILAQSRVGTGIHGPHCPNRSETIEPNPYLCLLNSKQLIVFSHLNSFVQRRHSINSAVKSVRKQDEVPLVALPSKPLMNSQ